MCWLFTSIKKHGKHVSWRKMQADKYVCISGGKKYQFFKNFVYVLNK